MFRLFPHLYIRLIGMVTLTLLLTACSFKSRTYEAPSVTAYQNAKVAGYKHIRYWGDKTAQYTYTRDNIKRLGANKNFRKRIDILALSGGAEDGAYGAGFLKGWSERGNRPEFTVVTGISTGALIAPFAFLGPKYDKVLQKLYTESSQKNIVLLSPMEALFGASLGDTAPLKKILSEEINDDFVAELAKEAKKGRLLQIGTTNLDAQRPVVWEITEIALSGRSDAPKLIRDIMLASASIPGAFPPVLIDVVINGKKYQEVHVDGGVTRQIFVYPRDLDIRKLQRMLHMYPQKNMWLIRNTKIDPEYKPVSLSLADIAERSFYTLTKYHGLGDLVNITSLAKRDGFHIHITNVPKSFDVPLEDFFDKKYMKALYQVGYEKGRSNSAWQTTLKF
ncbi:patatin-like phospholipase family protein [Sulfurovum sp. XTW-4]|uniref:Patatin-like phospholipase family protein n=1 Tax=Sulfurovum xiamenensis TaxID=3019066 RepID=A0ABT7QU52_9BACT|nr:patatin-like phospholipase family protein [Sulfurovum xiamenensis]MDM5264464.1 patatin-like phospholipase family protein [Sulfurovum xiamenensis]